MTAPAPAVSVIVPIYKVEQYLRQCLDSILAQTLEDMEVILVDDGSPDACPQICDEYAARDARVRVIHKPNGGYGHSCNVGLAVARGAYIAIAEPDDTLEADMYRALYAIAQEHDSDVVKSNFCVFCDIPGRNKCTVFPRAEIPQDRSFTLAEFPRFAHDHPSIWTCLYKADFLRQHQIRFIEAPGSGWTDNPFQIQTLCLAKKINYTDTAYYRWRVLVDDPADDLSDWTLPFKRSDEVHQWLNAQGITDEGIRRHLALRELDYINTVLKSISLSQLKEVRPCIERMLQRIPPALLQQAADVPPLYRRLYKLLSKGQYLRLKYDITKAKELRRFLFSLRLSKGSFLLQLFGIQLTNSPSKGKPALLRICLK